MNTQIQRCCDLGTQSEYKYHEIPINRRTHDGASSWMNCKHTTVWPVRPKNVTICCNPKWKKRNTSQFFVWHYVNVALSMSFRSSGLYRGGNLRSSSDWIRCVVLHSFEGSYRSCSDNRGVHHLENFPWHGVDWGTIKVKRIKFTGLSEGTSKFARCLADSDVSNLQFRNLPSILSFRSSHVVHKQLQSPEVQHHWWCNESSARHCIWLQADFCMTTQTRTKKQLQ